MSFLVGETIKIRTAVVGKGGQGLEKNFGHHSWPTDKILGFEWPKIAQIALKFLCFFQII